MRAKSHVSMLLATLISAAIRPSSGKEWRQKSNAGLYPVPTWASSPMTRHSRTLPPPSILLLRPAFASPVFRKLCIYDNLKRVESSRRLKRKAETRGSHWLVDGSLPMTNCRFPRRARPPITRVRASFVQSRTGWVCWRGRISRSTDRKLQSGITSRDAMPYGSSYASNVGGAGVPTDPIANSSA
jgi:hypothetical protein